MNSHLAHGKLGPMAWPLLVTMTLMLLMSIASLTTLSSLRAYVNGEGRWSKAEGQAIADLQRYAVTRDEADYRRFSDQLAVPLGDRVARLQLQGARPDVALATEGFLAGRNSPADIPGMIRLFRFFRSSHIMAPSIEFWNNGDVLIMQLADIGRRLHMEISNGNPDSAYVESLLQSAEQVHVRVAPLEDGFSTALGIASREVTSLLMIVTSLCFVTLVSLGIVTVRGSLRRSERTAAALRARLEHEAAHDPLTGLKNRREFEVRVAAAIEDQRACATGYALLYLDLDQFKVINDTCGHAAGDGLIRKIAWLIGERLRNSDVLARLGGDEFGALLHGIDCDNAVRVAEGIRRRIAELRFHWEGRVFAVNSSIGVIVLDETLATVGDALSAADQACYLAKDSGRNRVQLYRPDDDRVRSRHGEMRWVERLNVALDNENFVLVAQEIRSISPRSAIRYAPVHRFELLVRMIAPDGTWVAPMAFIPAAERYGLMPRIDRWVIAEACRELASLRTAGRWLPVCMINLSGASVSDPSLADYISDCLAQYSLPGPQMGFELTETAAIGNLASASHLMTRLRALGSPIALDDFGSGMSSFSYLKALPVDFLKIDGAFVRNVSSDPVDRAVVEAIQRVGHVMGIQTIAECVEDQAALKALTEIGVDYAQGFHVAAPALLSEIGAGFPKAGERVARVG
jgi:diguanylate cyclase (GGDEF)-like protein